MTGPAIDGHLRPSIAVHGHSCSMSVLSVLSVALEGVPKRELRETHESRLRRDLTEGGVAGGRGDRVCRDAIEQVDDFHLDLRKPAAAESDVLPDREID